MENASNITTVETAECRNYSGIFIALLIYSIFVLALYALLQRRVSKYKETFHGFLGIPMPINLIHETKDRWVYALAFGALTGDVLNIILDGNVLSSDSSVGSIWRGILLIIVMMTFPLLYFALFASIHGPLQIVSQIIGFIYILLLFIRLILSCSSCDNAIDDTSSPGILRNVVRALLYSECISIGICYVLIGAFFVWRGVQAIVYLIIEKPFPPQHTVSHHIGHVKRILNKPPPTVPSNRLFAIVQPYLYQWDPYFKFSVRVISAGFVIILALFLLTFQLVNGLIIIVNFLEVLIYPNLSLDADFVDAIVGLSYFFGIIVPFICYAITVIGFISSLASYKRQCKLLWKGDRSFLPAKKRPTARILLSSIHFFGFQVAMVVWAWILYSLILTLIVLAFLIFMTSMALFDFFREWILKQFILLTTSLVMGYIIYYAQLYFIKYAFVSKEERQKKPSHQSSINVKDQTCSTAHEDAIQTAGHGEIVLVDNRRLFHLFTFFFIFYYMLIGLFKAIRRIIISAVLNVFYLSRLDVPLTVKGWEFLDKAYVSYTAILKVDAAYNNPVMNVFIYLVSHVTEAKSARNKPSSSFPMSAIEKITVTNYYSRNLTAPLIVEHDNDVITSRAKKRWHLAYTLVRNPDLIVLRRRDQDMDSNKDATKDAVHINPAYTGDDGKLEGIPLSKDNATKL